MDVTIDEVTLVMRLVRDVSEHWDDPSAWRKHLLEGACRLLNGHVGVIMADYHPDGWFGSMAMASIVGLPEPMAAMNRDVVSQISQRQFQDVSETEPGMGVLIDRLRLQGSTRVAGTFTSRLNSNYPLEFFASGDHAGSGFGPGQTFLDDRHLSIEAGVNTVPFSIDLPALPSGQPYVTATATDITNAGTIRR